MFCLPHFQAKKALLTFCHRDGSCVALSSYCTSHWPWMHVSGGWSNPCADFLLLWSWQSTLGIPRGQHAHCSKLHHTNCGSRLKEQPTPEYHYFSFPTASWIPPAQPLHPFFLPYLLARSSCFLTLLELFHLSVSWELCTKHWLSAGHPVWNKISQKIPCLVTKEIILV